MPPQPGAISLDIDLALDVTKYYNDVVLGNDTLDNFDSFRDKWLRNGGQEVLDIYNALYKELGSPDFSHPEANKVREGFAGEFLYGN